MRAQALGMRTQAFGGMAQAFGARPRAFSQHFFLRVGNCSMRYSKHLFECKMTNDNIDA